MSGAALARAGSNHAGWAMMMRIRFAMVGLLVMGVGVGLLAAGARAAAKGLFPHRLRTGGRPCSLRGAPGRCSLESAAGASPGGALRVGFGEVNCTVELEGCGAGFCYSVLDLTSRPPFGGDEVFPAAGGAGGGAGGGEGGGEGGGGHSSLFSEMAAVEGASSTRHDHNGLAFRAAARGSGSGRVVLRYSTRTCHSFYQAQGHLPEQLCSEAMDAVSNVDSGLPVSLDCS